ncbi:hypothetical protein AB0G73_27825 [Streptomyces sp. NPDC020719]|uniref:hypothetical protein n=1 Tax=Streptomyces sp. NPDC020719 TaxID=3154896 RepID=UPI0033FC1BE9
MNQDTENLLHGAVDRVQRAIQDRARPAVAVLQGDRLVVLSDYDYLRDEETAAAFEERAAAKAREVHAVRWVFAVPQVLVLVDGAVAARAASDLPLREGEREAIMWMSCDPADGVDYGLVPYVRRPGCELVFDDPEVFAVPVRPGERVPGMRLLRGIA